MNVCAIDIGKGGGFAWIQSGLLGKEVMVEKMPSDIFKIMELIHKVPCEVFVLEDVQIRPSDMEDGKIYRIVDVMIKNLHYLEAAILLSGNDFIRLHPKRWTAPYKAKTKGLEYQERKRVLKGIAELKFPKNKVTLWNCDALLMLNHMFVEMQTGSDWIKEKESEAKRKLVF